MHTRSTIMSLPYHRGCLGMEARNNRVRDSQNDGEPSTESRIRGTRNNLILETRLLG